MSKKHFNAHAPLTVTFQEFHGISSPTSEQNHSPAKIVNFRIGEDGSLQKRCGAKALYQLPQKIRSHWSGYLNGSFHLYLLAGDTLYLGHLNRNNCQSIGKVSTTEGSATFFCLQGTLYLNDGETLYRIHGSELREAIGYVPLYGKDWDNDNMGEINEPFNILNPHVRISYHVSDPPSIFLRVPKTIRSVEAVWRNGVRLTKEEYRHNTEFNTIDVPGLEAEDRLDAYLTFEHDNTELRHLFSTMQGAVYFGSPDKSRTFFFGSQEANTIFCAEYVSADNQEHACREYDSDPLYLPEGNEFRIGAQHYPFLGALRHKDNLLLFTEGDTWLGSVDSTGHNPLPSVMINTELGCVSSDACVLAANDPITIGRHGLYLWQSTDPDLTQRDASLISQPLHSILTPDVLKTAALFYEPRRDELWVALPSRDEIWIRSMKRSEWFCFTEVPADRFFDADGQVGVISNDTVSIFQEDLCFDYDLKGEDITIRAVYETPPMNFGTERKKNLSYLSLDADSDGAVFYLNFSMDECRSVHCSTYDRLGRLHGTLPMRLRSGRFQNASLEILVENGNPVIHSLTLTAH